MHGDFLALGTHYMQRAEDAILARPNEADQYIRLADVASRLADVKERQRARELAELQSNAGRIR